MICGIIPCSGNATRMGGMPKFLLPSPENLVTLFDNTVKNFKNNGIYDVIVGTSTNNLQYFKKNDYIVVEKNTETMSETVKNIIDSFQYDSYVMMMPDTYFILGNELKLLVDKLLIYDCVVVLWKIRSNQYGKLGQIQINDNNVVDVQDKISCACMNIRGE